MRFPLLVIIFLQIQLLWSQQKETIENEPIQTDKKLDLFVIDSINDENQKKKLINEKKKPLIKKTKKRYTFH